MLGDDEIQCQLCYGGFLELKLPVIKFARLKVHGWTTILQYFAKLSYGCQVDVKSHQRLINDSPLCVGLIYPSALVFSE